MSNTHEPRTIYLSPSQITKYMTCGYQWYLAKEQRLESAILSANLAFGRVIDKATVGLVLAQHNAQPFDPVEAFSEAWDRQRAERPLQYSATMSAEDLTATGKRLVEVFGEAWDKSGYEPLCDAHGPLVQRGMSLEVAPGVILRGEPDVPYFDPATERVGVIDLKASAQPASEVFAALSDQLTTYQLFIDQALASDGRSERVTELAFWDLLKRKVPAKGRRGTGPKMEVTLSRRRNDDEIQAFLDKVVMVAEDIRRRRFPKAPGMAYNTPCQMCNFSGYCTQGDMSGLRVRPQRSEDRFRRLGRVA